MNIGILGSGRVGSALGRQWARLGHAVMFGSRTPDRLRDMVKSAGPNARAGTSEEVVAFADVILLSVPWTATRETVTSVVDWRGKVLIDAVNRLRDLPPVDSIGASSEDVAHWARGAWVVKAFNTIGSEVMDQPVFDGDRAALLLCGDDPDAKAVVAGLASEIGFEPVDAGGIKMSEIVDHMTRLWIGLATNTPLGRNFAFKLLSRD